MNKKAIYILLGISFVLFLVLSIVFNNKASNAIINSRKSLKVFSNTVSHNDAYIYVDILSEDNRGYAIVFHDNNPSVVYFNDKLLEEIKGYTFDSMNIKLVGDSFEITDEIKDNVLKVYNKESEVGDEDYLTKDDFGSVFGSYYLDVTRIEDDNTLHKTPKFLSSLFLDISLFSLLVLGFKIMFDKRNNQ